MFSDVQLGGVPECPLDPTPEQEDAYTTALCSRVETLRETAQARLDVNVRAAQRDQTRRDKGGIDPTTLFHFQPGELVWRRAKGWLQGSKLQPKAVGPFRVLKFKGLLGQRVLVEALPQVHHKRRREPLWVHAA